MPRSPADDRFEQARAAFVDGLKCQQAGVFAEAETHYRNSLSLLPGRASTLINLAATQLQLARPQDALASAEGALAAEPDSTDALLHRATALAQLGRLPDALAAFERLLSLNPACAPAWSMRGSLLREMQRFDEAAQAFRQALHHGADPELNAYYLAAVEARNAPPASPHAYVRGLFDRYADEFDQHLLERLHYQGHRHLIEGLLAISGARYESALDLGCGTGLCGALVRPQVGRLTGVDLSARMLDKARELGVYDRLVQADVVEFMGRADQRHELLLAADVFIYIGDLQPLFEAARRVMDRGVFCFSVEAIEGGDADFQLQPSLRYAHSKPYLLRLAAQHGFDLIAMQSAPVREDQRETVDGLYVYLKRVAIGSSLAKPDGVSKQPDAGHAPRSRDPGDAHLP